MVAAHQAHSVQRSLTHSLSLSVRFDLVHSSARYFSFVSFPFHLHTFFRFVSFRLLPFTPLVASVFCFLHFRTKKEQNEENRRRKCSHTRRRCTKRIKRTERTSVLRASDICCVAVFFAAASDQMRTHRDPAQYRQSTHDHERNRFGVDLIRGISFELPKRKCFK